MTLQPADLDRLEQLAREADDGSGWFDAAEFRGDGYDPATAQLVSALDPAVVSELVAAARLGAAWQEAEGALPEGWQVGRLLRTAPTLPEQWMAFAQWGKPNQNYNEFNGPWAATPAAALLALAEALRARP